MQMATRVLIGGGVAYNLALGFIPTCVEGFTYNATPDSIVRFRWEGPLAEDNAVIVAGGGVYGHSIDGAVVAELTADTGMSSYEGAKTPQVRTESPAGGQVLASVVDYTVARSTAATARSATAVGTLLRPTTHNGYVYECTTAGTGAAEPTWPTTPGETVQDNSSVTYTCREENVVNAGELGVTLGATLMTDSNTVVVHAYKADTEEDLGDIG